MRRPRLDGNDIKLSPNPGVELQPTATPGVLRAAVVDIEKRFDLTWDRFARLSKTAQAILGRIQVSDSILDVGGFDGALAMFLSQYQVDVIDPITTGGTAFSITENSYDVVVSIDALEHVAPDERLLFLEQLAKAARHLCFINFPAQHTHRAQELLYELTDNPLLKEHVMWSLPDMQRVKCTLESFGFQVETLQHTSLSQWISQYVLQTVAPEAAAKVNRHLLEHHNQEPTGTHLYDLLIGRRPSRD